MSKESYRLPTGITVAQAKKDAKRLAKQHSIPLHQAQDQIAQKNTGTKSWTQAMEVLASGASTSLSNLKLPVRDLKNANPMFVDLSQRPGLLIVGHSGSGKTVMAVRSAVQALGDGVAEIHYINCGWEVEQLVEPHSRDAAMAILGEAREREPSRVKISSLERGKSPEKLIRQASPGSVVVLDESFSMGGDLESWLSAASSVGCALIACVQVPTDFAPLASSKSFDQCSQYIESIIATGIKKAMIPVDGPGELEDLWFRATQAAWLEREVVALRIAKPEGRVENWQNTMPAIS